MEKNFVLINPLKAELNPTCHLLAVLAHHVFHVSELRVNVSWRGEVRGEMVMTKLALCAVTVAF